MKLRLRLILTTFAVMAPLLVVVGWLSTRALNADFDHRMVEFVLTQMLSGERERCELSPDSWSLEVRPPRAPRGSAPRAFAVDADLRAAHPQAPRLSDALLLAKREHPEADSWSEHSEGMELLLRMPWGFGPCAYALVTAPRPEMLLPPVQVWLPPLAVVALALMISVGSVVRRIRTLTREVEATTQEGYLGEIHPEGRDEISDLAHAFARASEQIRTHIDLQARKERALREFLANTTHDVMIPLTVIQGHLSQFESQALQGIPISESDARAAVGETIYMSSLLHNLALAARLEAGEPNLQPAPVDLKGLAERVIGRYSHLAQQRSVALNSGAPPEPVWVQGDSTMLEQMVSNLVYNAVRYNRAGGNVGVVVEKAGESFVFRVLDDGPGVAPDQLAKLAQRGFRTDSARSRAPGGQGLGLAIATEVAERHGFTLRMSTPEEGGLCAEFAGPCASNG